MLKILIAVSISYFYIKVNTTVHTNSNFAENNIELLSKAGVVKWQTRQP